MSNEPSLSEVITRGREERRKAEAEREAKREIDKDAEGNGDSSSDEDFTMIAETPEMKLLTRKLKNVQGTGFLYDPKFALHKNDWEPSFPEKPKRVTESFKRCCQLGLVKRCKEIQSCNGNKDQILALHSQEALDVLHSSKAMDINQRKELSKKYEDVYFHSLTYDCALLAVGSTVEMMEQILKKNVRNGFALVRPPGHHAMKSEYCGFCFLNNVAIAAKHAVDNLGLQRVLIVDWDVHHGQATQQMFYDDPRVLYFSIHRYEYGNYWPNLRESDYDYIGEGNGTGFNINVPLNEIGMGDSDYLAIMHQILMPVAYEFSPDIVLISSGYDAAIGCPEYSPELVIVSCGFDAAIGDVKGQMLVSPAAYAHFIHMLSGLAEGRVCTVLEGGYNILSLSEGVALCVRELLGDPCPLLKPTQEPSENITETILNVIKALTPYWKCFQHQLELEEDEVCAYPWVCEQPPKPDVQFETPETKPKEYTLDYTYPYEVEEEYFQAEEKWTASIQALIAETDLTVPPHRTCLVYDPGMKAHKAINYIGHPEKPSRISRIYEKHREWGLLDRCMQLPCRLAMQEELELVHSSHHIEFMKNSETKEPLELTKLSSQFASVYFCKAASGFILGQSKILSFDKELRQCAEAAAQGCLHALILDKESNICAKMATGCTLSVIDKVLTGEARNGVAIVRPPGHHAECNRPMGFCFFNTVAIAARYAQRKYNVKRVMIVDWDIHHGNATQHTFYEDPSVLYISLHRFDDGVFFPSADDGSHLYAGRGAGEGFNVNIPWNYGGKGDPEYLAAFQQVVMPIAYEFAPDLVLVSAGFDSAIGDPLGGCKVTPVGYGHMTHMLSGLANGRVVLVLEGGYNLVSIANCMATCTSVLLGDSVPEWGCDIRRPQQGAIDTINGVLDVHKNYWKSLKFRVAIPIKRPVETAEIPEWDQPEVPADRGETGSTANSLQSFSTDLDEIQKQLNAVTLKLGSGNNSLQAVNSNMADAGSSQDGAEGGQVNTQSELLDYLQAQGIQEMYAVITLKDCDHLSMVGPVPEEGLNVNDPCFDCQATGENWVCLVCYKVYCSRYVNEHMVKHGEKEDHPIVLSYADLSVWCYKCESYMENDLLKPALNSAHQSKFGTGLTS